MNAPLKAPFPYFGGKSKIASVIWQALGDVDNYVEPFLGSAAVLLARPGGARGTETVNDKDGFLANFWRSVKSDPEGVARHADNPVNEVDLHARHYWLITEGARAISENAYDPEWFDSKIAGWWVWGACCWIGAGWCNSQGPWVVRDGALVKDRRDGEVGMKRVLPRDTKVGVTRKVPHIGDGGRGINRSLPHTGDGGRSDFIEDWMIGIHNRIRDVRVASGDFHRILGSGLRLGKTVGIVLDPPYAALDRDKTYANDEDDVSDRARDWAVEYAAAQGDRARIVFCGYDGQSDDEQVLGSAGWVKHAWKAAGGYGNRSDGRGKANASREVLWFSPGCLPVPAP